MCESVSGEEPRYANISRKTHGCRMHPTDTACLRLYGYSFAQRGRGAPRAPLWWSGRAFVHSPILPHCTIPPPHFAWAMHFPLVPLALIRTVPVTTRIIHRAIAVHLALLELTLVHGAIRTGERSSAMAHVPVETIDRLHVNLRRLQPLASVPYPCTHSHTLSVLTSSSICSRSDALRWVCLSAASFLLWRASKSHRRSPT